MAWEPSGLSCCGTRTLRALEPGAFEQLLQSRASKLFRALGSIEVN